MDKPAFPQHTVMPTWDKQAGGLSRRELFAAMAMQGFCSNPNRDENYETDAASAIKQADALIAELDKK